MSKEELTGVEVKFNEFFLNTNDNVKKFNKCVGYWFFIKKGLLSINSDTEPEVQTILRTNMAELLLKTINWMVMNNIKAKEFSSNWNTLLVKRTGDFVDSVKNKIKNEERLTPREEREKATLLSYINESEDFATIVFCYQMLQLDGVVRLEKVIEELKSKRYTNDEKKYWHSDVKEFITVTDCAKRGLKPWLLWEIDGCFKGLAHIMTLEECETYKNNYQPKVLTLEEIIEASVEMVTKLTKAETVEDYNRLLLEYQEWVKECCDNTGDNELYGQLMEKVKQITPPTKTMDDIYNEFTGGVFVDVDKLEDEPTVADTTVV